MKEFHKNLKDIMKLRSLTQMDVVKAAGTTEATVSRWLSGINEPKLSYIIKLCKNLQISINELTDLD